MHRKHALVILAVLLLCISQAGAVSVTFTGNVAADFAGKGALTKVDDVGDPTKSGFMGCQDVPLGAESFDPAFGIPPDVLIPPSGLNVGAVTWVYDCETDTLYLGLNIPGPWCNPSWPQKLAWDAEGDGVIGNTNRDVLAPLYKLKQTFTGDGLEDYQIFVQANNATASGAFLSDFNVHVFSSDGGVTVLDNFGSLPAGITVVSSWKGGLGLTTAAKPDVEVAIHGIRAKYGLTGLTPSIRIQTRSGATGDLVTEDLTDTFLALPCVDCLSITKGVSCSPNGPFVPNVQALRGAPVYFEIKVTNCGTDNLKNVVVTDTMLNAGGALLACTGCTGTASCIPGTITIGNLAVGATATFVCTVPTNPAYAANVLTPDATNTASVAGVGVLTNLPVNAGPVSATVDVLVPSITCDKQVASNVGLTDLTHNLNLPLGGNAWYKFCVTNNGETSIDFTAGSDLNCPKFSDDFIKPGGTTIQLQGNCGTGPYLIPGTNQDLNALFRAQLQTQFGSKILPPGQTVCIVPLPVTFDQTKVCCAQGTWTDTFTACGRAIGTCLPPGGAEGVSTGNCQATVSVCPPDVCIEKRVSCSPDGPFGPTNTSVTAERGANVYFQIKVTNCGGEALNNVIVTDTLLTEVDNALLSCSGCTNGLNCIPTSTGLPVQTNIGSLAIGQSKTFVCTALTNAAFAIVGSNPDITNRASVTATSAVTATAVSKGPSDASVNLLIPRIICSKLVADNPNMTNATQHLNLSDSVMDTEQAWYEFSVTNTGESAVSFVPGIDPNCPKFSDTFIKPGGTTSPTCNSGPIVIPGTNQDLNALFLARLVVLFGSQSLPAGQTVSVRVGPVSFDETQLCCVQKVWPDTFSACGKATQTGVCLPPGGAESVTTGDCNADVTICSPPKICLDKKVSCSPTGPWTASVTALRGSTVYFQIAVTNCGGDNLKDVVITDTKTDPNGALLACTGCVIGVTPTTCIPGTITVGNLAVGETKTVICTVPTNPAFATNGISPDATNTASVTGKSVRTNAVVNAGPVSATVNLLVPSITCTKQVASNAQLTDLTNDLNLAALPLGTKQAWYKFCVTNNGETPVDFTAVQGQNCPSFTDDFIKPGGTTIQLQQPCGTGPYLIPGTDQDLNALFRAKLTNNILAAGQTVCVTLGVDPGTQPVTFDETKLCCTQSAFTDHFTACGKAIGTNASICLPPGGGEGVSTGICAATVRICPAKICITKKVSCSSTGPWTDSVTALRGSTVYFQIIVTNCGGKTLSNVTLTDTLADVDNALLNCAGCTGVTPAICIPGTFNLGTMNPGSVKTIVCTFPTNPNFSVLGIPIDAIDATNTARVTAGVVNPDVGQPTTVSDGPVSATVNLLVPGIECDLLMDDDDNFAVDAGDLTPPAVNLNLSMNGAPQVEHVWKLLTVCNTGEVEVSFVAGAGPCTDFDDPLVESFGIDVAQKFRDALVAAFGSQVLPQGQCVTVELGPLEFDENVLCPNTPIIVNRFSACGFATRPDICLPPAGGETVNTGLCQGTIMLCQPVLFQAVPGNSLGLDVHQMGHLGNSGEVISSAPGLFVLVPGSNWENFVAAAQVDQPYTLKNVTLIKQTPEFIQCADVFPPITVQQQGTAGIRLRWPLMYEAPGTTFTLIIQYGTNSLFDDDGILGPNIPAYFHENVWEWKVEATLESMKLLLELFHQIPFGLDEVPLISDEVLYPILQQKLDMIIQLVAEDEIREAALLLGDFEMEVADACIAVSPRLPYPTGPGTGIAGTEENPACCKLLVDAEYVGFKLGLFQATK